MSRDGGKAHNSWVFAVDCGGSHTTALLIGPDGDLVRTLDGHEANLQTLGAAGVAQRVSELMEGAPEAERLALGVAGLRGDTEALSVVEALAQRGIHVPVAVYADVRIALRAGTPGDGVVVVAGTGVSAYGRSGEREAGAGGWGSTFGDIGGAYWMVTSLVREALRAVDEGDSSGAGILSAVLAEARLPDADSLRRFGLGEGATARIAALLPAAVRLWREGHPLIRSLLVDVAAEVARLARSVARQLELRPGQPLIVSGGMPAAFPELPAMIAEATPEVGEVRVLERDPAWGAYWLAREEDAWILPDRAPVPVTEQPNPVSEGIGSLSTLELLRMMNGEDAGVPTAVSGCLFPLAALVDETAARMRRGGRLIYVGAGTSGRLAMLDAVECVPTFGLDPGRVVALIAGGLPALTHSIEGAEDDAAAGAEAVYALLVTGIDTVVGVSASGGAAYVLAALDRARAAGAATALISCNPAASTLGSWDFGIVAPVGPEVIAGSTRLKAGTAQKLILNMLSTAVMVRLGRTAGNRMVGMRPVNAKLRARAVRLVAERAGASPEQARAALEATGWDVVEAVLTLRLGDAAEAHARLRAAAGDLARALQDID